MTMTRWQPIYFGLGSNLDDPMAQLRSAVTALRALSGLRLYRVSSVVRSAPIDRSDQPEYLNVVAIGMTRLAALDLLDHCQRIEAAAGRDHEARRWSARPLDIDLLALGKTIHTDPRLTLPHAQLARRAFVLGPLAELAPHTSIPGLGRVATLLQAVDLGTLTAAGKLFPDAWPDGLS